MYRIISTLIIAAGLVNPSFAGPDYSKVNISSTKITDNIYMLQGEGGNLAISVGEDGVLLIDDQFAPLSEKILAAIKKICDKPIKFVVNTHWHFDHAGGNENMSKQGAIIVAHDNVRKRLKSGGEIKAFSKKIEPAVNSALPVITFTDNITFHWNNDTLDVMHSKAAHTDGDAVIYFTAGNVVHAGDVYFNGLYPFIDSSSGGSFKGTIDGVNKILSRIDDDTKVIPGHGPLSNKKELTEYRDMLQTVYKRLSKMKRKGKTIEAVLAAEPVKDFEAKWGNGFLDTKTWLGIVYEAL